VTEQGWRARRQGEDRKTSDEMIFELNYVG